MQQQTQTSNAVQQLQQMSMYVLINIAIENQHIGNIPSATMQEKFTQHKAKTNTEKKTEIAGLRTPLAKNNSSWKCYLNTMHHKTQQEKPERLLYHVNQILETNKAY